MVRIADEFPSKALKAEDLGDRDIVLTIKDYEIKDFKNDRGSDKKILLTFMRTDKELIVNKTNMMTIAKLYGDELDDWIGKKITLYQGEANFQGKIVPAVRIKPRIPSAGATTPPASPPPPPPTEAPEADGGNDDDIPF